MANVPAFFLDNRPIQLLKSKCCQKKVYNKDIIIATNQRVLVAVRLERLCSVLFTPIHLQIRIENIFEIAQFRYLYGVDTGNQSRSN